MDKPRHQDLQHRCEPRRPAFSESVEQCQWRSFVRILILGSKRER